MTFSWIRILHIFTFIAAGAAASAAAVTAVFRFTFIVRKEYVVEMFSCFTARLFAHFSHLGYAIFVFF